MPKSHGPDEERTQVVPPRAGASPRRDGDLDNVETQLIQKKSNIPVARLVVVEGPGAGTVRAIYAGTNSLGREAKNRVPLDFGDDMISRLDHAVIVADDRVMAFSIHDGGKTNPVYVNDAMVNGESRLGFGDIIELGRTRLRFDPVG